MKDLLCIGDIKLDTFIAIPDASVLCSYKKPTCQLCIAHGTKIPVDEVDHQVAGSAPNVAIGVARLGGSTGVMSTMGRDFVYKQACAFLRKEGVSTRYIAAVRGKQSSFSAVLNYQGESTQLAGHAHTPFNIPSRFPSSAWGHLSELGSSYDGLFTALLNHKKRCHCKLSFNPGAIQIEERTAIFHQMLEVTDVLSVNKVEAGIICGTTKGNIKEMLQLLMNKTKGIIVITDGKDGAYATDRKMTYHAPMFPGERIEATGAGDAFTSGFLGAIIAGLPVQDALAWGSVNAASVVQYIGPTQGLLTRTQIADLLAQHSAYRVIPT